MIEHAGVTKGTFFYHFKTKHDLAAALIERYANEDQEHFFGAMARAEQLARDPLEQLLIFVGLFIEMTEKLEEPFPGCLYASYCYTSGSISGQVADPSMALYNASKAFVHGLTRSIAVDHGPAIRCNAILPGWIETGMLEAGFDLAGNPDTAKRDALARHAARRFGKPADIAAMAVWLASDESSFATGQLFTVDGGLTAASPLNPGLF